MASQDSLAAAALVVALVALFTTFVQVLQAFFSTADGYRRCQPSVIGPWARRTRLRFRWTQFRFETLFTVPHVVLYKTVWDSASVPASPYDMGGWITGALSSDDKDDTNLLVSGNAEPAPELVTWLRFLRSIQWTHKRMIFQLSMSRIDTLDEKNGLDLARLEHQKLTIPFVKFEERSWDFIPVDIIKPLARINLGDLGILARRLGMDWERFEPSDGTLRAQGNGYTLTSVIVRSIGVVVEFSEIGGYGNSGDSLPWLTPVIPGRAKEKAMLIPSAASDKLAFGVLPGIWSDFISRDFDVSNLAGIADMIRYFISNDADDTVVSAFESGEWQQSGWCPGVADILTLVSPMIYRPDVTISGVPRPDNDGIFYGVTDVGSAYLEFKTQVGNLLESKHGLGDDLSWVQARLREFSEYERFFSREIDWLDLYYRDDSARRQETAAREMAYHAYFAATTRLSHLVKAVQLPSRRNWFWYLIQFHIRCMFNYEPYEQANDLYTQQGAVHSAFPYPASARNEQELWRERMAVYFQRLPELVSRMLLESQLGEVGLSAEQATTAWVLMMFRAICWSRCHTLIPGKTLPIQYCGSQLPVFIS